MSESPVVTIPAQSLRTFPACRHTSKRGGFAIPVEIWIGRLDAKSTLTRHLFSPFLFFKKRQDCHSGGPYFSRNAATKTALAIFLVVFLAGFRDISGYNGETVEVNGIPGISGINIDGYLSAGRILIPKEREIAAPICLPLCHFISFSPF
jgi:hypothetical protein